MKGIPKRKLYYPRRIADPQRLLGSFKQFRVDRHSGLHLDLHIHIKYRTRPRHIQRNTPAALTPPHTPAQTPRNWTLPPRIV